MSADTHPQTGQPVGVVVDATPAQRPGPVILQGHYGRLEKLAPQHAATLWDAVKDHDAIWTYMSSYGPFGDADEFAGWVAQRATLEDPYAYAIVDSDNRCVGIATLMEIRPAMRVVEVGHIVYAPALQRTQLGTEAQYLLARYAFETLGYRRYEWKCDSLNAPSRAAALRLGFRYEGLFRQAVVYKGRNRDTAWFSIIDGEWPALKRAYQQWLAPENFDGGGRQKRKLSDLIAEVRGA